MSEQGNSPVSDESKGVEAVRRFFVGMIRKHLTENPCVDQENIDEFLGLIDVAIGHIAYGNFIGQHATALPVEFLGYAGNLIKEEEA